MDLKDKLRYVENFPKHGVRFIDITTLLNDAEAFQEAVSVMADAVRHASPNVNVIVGAESRGFIFGAAVANKLGVRFVPVRKPGKLPYKTLSYTYDLEYGSDTLEIHTDSITSEDTVVIIDDVLATGGTAVAVSNMVKSLSGKYPSGAVFLVKIEELDGSSFFIENGIPIYYLIIE